MKTVYDILALVGVTVLGLSCDTPWQPQAVTDAYSDLGLYVQQARDGGYIVVGETHSFGAGSSDVWLIKTQADGSEQWNQTFGGTQADWGYTVQQSTDGGYILIGSTSSYGAGQSDVWLIKTDASGAMQWNQTFGNSESDYGYFVQQTSDGGYILVGESFNSGSGTRDVYLVKTDDRGNQVWAQAFGDSSEALGYAVWQTSGGGYIITGFIDSFVTGQTGIWLIKTDGDGTKGWDQIYATSKSAVGRSVQQTADGGYAIVGFRAYSDGSYDAWLIKTDSLGNIQWEQTFGGNGDDLAAAIQQTSDEGYIIIGLTQSYGAGLNDVWLIKTDASGAEQWSRTFGGSSWDVGRSVQQTADGGYIIGGTTQSFGAGDADFWLIKTEASGMEQWNQTFGGGKGP